MVTYGGADIIFYSVLTTLRDMVKYVVRRPKGFLIIEFCTVSRACVPT